MGGKKELSKPVTLGPLDSQHMRQARAWRNDPRIWKWCRQQRPITEAEQWAWFEGLHGDPTVQMRAIMIGGEFAGVCGLTSIDLVNRRAEFSLYVGPEHQRQGVARKALGLLFEHGFKDWGLRSIWGETFHGNPAIPLFVDLGMTREGTRRDFYFRSGEFVDAHLYSILANEWGNK